MVGKTLGHYRIGEQLGRGGMGEVYIADDLNLNRKVALKFLPDTFAADPERMARFEREAKLLASLNHPGIAAIYGLEQADGKRFLALELVEGETLAQRISKGPLSFEEALGICRQIAEALEAAHEKGVIHRDLKPANVMIADGDKVKILDFGLAKALSDETQSVDASHSPTLTEAMTRPGVILGTAAYMSPEQAKGKSVDKRADIWAFGCILYECLTGKRAFEGEAVTETLAAILRGEPDWQALPASTPANIRFVLRRCLEKNASRRFHHAADLKIEIEETREAAEIPVPGKHSWLVWTWASIAIVSVIALAVLGFFYFHNQTPAEAMQFHVTVPPMLNENSIAISPNGRMIAFVAQSSESASALFVREIGAITPRPLNGTEGAEHPFWSPDSLSIGFFAEGRLKRVEVSGGLSRDICAATGAWGGTWNQNGTIIFSIGLAPLYSVSAAGGEPSAVTSLDMSKKEIGHFLPCFLPDGRHYLYGSGDASKTDIYLGSLDSMERIRLLTDVIKAAYAEPGYLLFYRGRTLFAQPFNAKKLTFYGEPAGIADNLLIDRYKVACFTVSQNGRLVYRSGTAQAKSQFIWFDRAGKQLGPAGEPGMYERAFDLSLDGQKIAAVRTDPRTSQPDIWIIEWERNVSTRLTFDPALAGDVVWCPDGLRIAFNSFRKGNAVIYEKKSSGVGGEALITESAKNAWIEDWSKDGRYIAYGLGLNPTDLYVIPLFGDRKPVSIVQSPFNKDEPHFSFDGKWLAYGSDESGVWQVYVISFPAADQKRQVSTSGGGQPRWRQDGKELYYLASDGKMMAVDIRVGAGIKPGVSHELFDTGLSVDPILDQYAVTPDGRRFLILKSIGETAATPITVILNWTSLLNK
jgi:eukaryotic-like serine/threonine-protein kinase